MTRFLGSTRIRCILLYSDVFPAYFECIPHVFRMTCIPREFVTCFTCISDVLCTVFCCILNPLYSEVYSWSLPLYSVPYSNVF